MADVDTCERCDHPLDPHVMVGTSEGIMVCPVVGCRCWIAWTYDEAEDAR